MYLHTRKPEDELPGAEVTKDWDRGCNIQTMRAIPEVVSRFHANNQIVGVWVDKKVTFDEGPDLWNSVLSLGIDFLCTDHPLEAIEVRSKFY